MNKQLQWYIEFDNKTFQILRKNLKYQRAIFKAAQYFEEVHTPASEVPDSTVAEWVLSLSAAVRDIVQLLYNFFYVEEKLVEQEIIKGSFRQLCTILKVETYYSAYFEVGSHNFRMSRILASMIRFNRFMEALFEHLHKLKKNLDLTFLQNLDEVYIFIQQKLKETLVRTQSLGQHDINIIILDTLSLLLRNFGDSTMHKILDQQKVSKIIDSIEKENQVYQEFEECKKKEEKEYRDKYFNFVESQPLEEDPNNVRRPQDDPDQGF